MMSLRYLVSVHPLACHCEECSDEAILVGSDECSGHLSFEH